MIEFSCPEVTQCNLQDGKIQLLANWPPATMKAQKAEFSIFCSPFLHMLWCFLCSLYMVIWLKTPTKAPPATVEENMFSNVLFPTFIVQKYWCFLSFCLVMWWIAWLFTVFRETGWECSALIWIILDFIHPVLWHVLHLQLCMHTSIYVRTHTHLFTHSFPSFKSKRKTHLFSCAFWFCIFIFLFFYQPITSNTWLYL